MKKYRFYIIITIALSAMAVYLLINDRPGTLKANSNNFAITDTSEITVIHIQSAKSTVNIERIGSGWQVNNNTNAKPKAIKALLNLLSGIEISSPVPNSMKTIINKCWNKNTVKVSIESNGKTIKAYELNDNDSLHIGTIAKLQGDNEPYIVHFIGFNGPMSHLFQANPKFWRNNIIFNYQPSKILSVEITYPLNPEASFVYRFESNKGLQIFSPILKKEINIEKQTALNFLLPLSQLTFEQEVTHWNKELYDSLSKQKPICQIRVKSINNQMNSVKLFHIPIDTKSTNFNPDRMYAVLQNDTAPVIVKTIDLYSIMKGFNDFTKH